MKQEAVRVLSNQSVGEDAFVIRLESHYMSTEVTPGQFFHVRVHDGVDPLLRRPLSLHRRSAEEGWIELLYKLKGRGTGLLAKRRPGEDVDVIGPLGAGFPPIEAALHMVAGGMGVAPLAAVVGDDMQAVSKITVLIGARSESALLCVNEFREMGADVLVATEDGSAGFKGFVSDLLATLDKPSAVFSCGPSGMTKAIVRYALDKDVSCFSSVEERMGCAIGMCRGCAIPISEGGITEYRRACKDGPVFSAKQLAAWAGWSGRE